MITDPFFPFQKKEIRQHPAFGRTMRKEFLMNPDFTLLDHGAYGMHFQFIVESCHKCP